MHKKLLASFLVLILIILIMPAAAQERESVEGGVFNGSVYSVGFEVIVPKEVQLGDSIELTFHIYAPFQEVQVKNIEIFFGYYKYPSDIFYSTTLLQEAKLDMQGITRVLLIKPPKEGVVQFGFSSSHYEEKPIGIDEHGEVIYEKEVVYKETPGFGYIKVKSLGSRLLGAISGFEWLVLIAVVIVGGIVGVFFRTRRKKVPPSASRVTAS